MRGIHFTQAGLGKQALGYRIQGSFVTGYRGLTAPPNERFYLGGDTDLRGFDIRAATPVAFLADKLDMSLTAPDGTLVPLDPNNPRRGAYTIPVPIWRLVYPGGDTSIVTNVEYRIPIAGPVTLAAFMDAGWNMAVRQSQLRLSDVQLNVLNNTQFGCPYADITLVGPGNPFGCVVGIVGQPATGSQPGHFSKEIVPISGTNYVTRMSTGLELQVIMPVVNAPFRLYYAFNPLRVDTLAIPPSNFTRNMFPAGGSGDFSFQQAQALYNAGYRIREPGHAFRFTVATTF
jgi:outer membrane protein insertion porin family